MTGSIIDRDRTTHSGYDIRLQELHDGPAVPGEPDRAWVDAWLHRSYEAYWATLPR